MKIRLARAVIVMALALPSAAGNAAECTVVAAAGNGPTEAIATIMSTHGLENILEAKGLKGQGPVQTKCAPGAVLTECRSQQKACK